MADVIVKDATGAVDTFNNVKKVRLDTTSGETQDFILPIGTKTISTTQPVDVSEYASAQVVDENLISSNIRSDVNILGVTGSYSGGGGGLDGFSVWETMHTIRGIFLIYIRAPKVDSRLAFRIVHEAETITFDRTVAASEGVVKLCIIGDGTQLTTERSRMQVYIDAAPTNPPYSTEVQWMSNLQYFSGAIVDVYQNQSSGTFYNPGPYNISFLVYKDSTPGATEQTSEYGIWAVMIDMYSGT